MLKIQTIVEQVSSHLREGLEGGRWTGLMPGRDRLTAELGVNKSTIDLALVKLEEEGWLQSQGPGKRRRINASKRKKVRISLEIILYEPADRQMNYITELHHQLDVAGHVFTFAPKSLMELKQDPQRVAKMVQARQDKAWILMAASRAVLEWISESSLQAFALYGPMSGLPIAGTAPDMLPPLRKTLRHLLELGHERIVMLVREERQESRHGMAEQIFIEELKQRGIPTGSYNLPDWGNSPEELRQCLNSLFAFTPPSAILINDHVLFLGVQNYIARQRGLAMRKVTLICCEYDPRFDWCSPPVPHFRWDYQPLIRRIVQWADDLAQGKENRQQHLIPAKIFGLEGLQGPTVEEN